MPIMPIAGRSTDQSTRDYGTPLADVKRLAKYWQTQYNWRKHEVELNSLPNYQTSVKVKGFGELDIHYVHQPSESADAIPLLFVHGW